jgi:hypothetical protein
MSDAFSFFGRAALVAGAFVAACTSAKQPHATSDTGSSTHVTGTEAGAGGDTGEANSSLGGAGNTGKGDSSQAGAAGELADTSPGGADDSGVHVSGVPGYGAVTADGGAPSDAGTASDAGSAGRGSDEGALPKECDIDGGCNAVCHGQEADCTVVTSGFACELDAVAGSTAHVACGQTATAGMANCGGCGPVTVQVYFDGAHCWEGIPACFGGEFYLPHAPN